MYNNDLACLLAIWRTPGIGPAQFAELQEKFLSPQEAVKHLPIKPDWQNVENDLQWASQPNHRIITFEMLDYPQRLREIASAPPILFIDGDVSLLNSMQIAIVGSRNPTPSGEDTSYQFAKIFSCNGFVVTSGLALGIDAACHEGALANQGKTIAVMGTGIDEIYPKRHQALAKKIAESGAVITEFPTGVKAMPHHFPRRNRIISGLSLGVLVVEAAYGSGSLITARYALEQNREVFAVPGSIHNPLSRGCHHLIKQGAKLVETAQDVVEELALINPHPSFGHPLPQAGEGKLISKLLLPQEEHISTKFLSSTESKLLNCVGYEATTIDLIIERSGLTAEQVSSILLLLELEGHIASVPGGYCRVRIK